MDNYRPKRLGLMITDECYGHCDHCGVITNSGQPQISLEVMNSCIDQASKLGINLRKKLEVLVEI